jgi:predicted DNA-binding transcriptional regulator AlpA
MIPENPRRRTESAAGSHAVASVDKATDKRTDLATVGPATRNPPATAWPSGDTLMTILDIRRLFKLGRTAAYELTRRQGFPAPVHLSSRCYRWWASEVTAFAGTVHRKPATRRVQASTVSSAASLRIIGRSRSARRGRASIVPRDREDTA